MSMKYLLTGSEMAECDRFTSEGIGIPSIVLMERAALSVADEVSERFDFAKQICVIAGRGNNGADAICAGRILIDRGYRVSFFMLKGRGNPIPEHSNMHIQLSILEAYHQEVRPFEAGDVLRQPADVVIEGLFGTGLSRDLEGEAAAAVSAINELREREHAFVVSVDIPSGISSDDGHVCGTAVRSDLTVTFAYYKRGHMMYPGNTFCGDIRLREIGITDLSFRREPEKDAYPEMFTYMDSTAGELLPERISSGNKGTFGKVLIIAGTKNVCGAALMSAKACARAGAGMVKVFTREENRMIIQEMMPEAMLTTYTENDEKLETLLRSDLQWADTVACGPGIGLHDDARRILNVLAEEVDAEKNPEKAAENTSQKAPHFRSLVLDADALRLIADGHELGRALPRRSASVGCIMTPHLAEFAALAHRSIGECRKQFPDLVRRLAKEFGCVVNCKDARSLVASPKDDDPLYLNTSGNSGMATAGSGDVLTGITAATVSVIRDPFRAACAAAYLHGKSGDEAAAELGERSMTATDLIRCLPAVL